MHHHIIFLIDFKLITKESSKATFFEKFSESKGNARIYGIPYNLWDQGSSGAFNLIVQHIFTSGENHQKDNII